MAVIYFYLVKFNNRNTRHTWLACFDVTCNLNVEFDSQRVSFSPAYFLFSFSCVYEAICDFVGIAFATSIQLQHFLKSLCISTKNTSRNT